MLGETIQRAELRQSSQFFFRKRNPPFEIIERLKWSILSLPHDFFAMLLPQSIHHAKAEADGVVIDDRATPVGLRDAHRLDFHVHAAARLSRSSPAYKNPSADC